MWLTLAFLLLPDEIALKLYISNVVVECHEIHCCQFSAFGEGTNDLDFSTIVIKMCCVKFELAQVCGKQYVTATLECVINYPAKRIYFDVLRLAIYNRGKFYQFSKMPAVSGAIGKSGQFLNLGEITTACRPFLATYLSGTLEFNGCETDGILSACVRITMSSPWFFIFSFPSGATSSSLLAH